MKLVLPNERPMSMNKLYPGGNAATWIRQREAARIHELVFYELHNQYPELPILKFPVAIIMVVYFNKRAYDSSNCPIKLYEDGLVRAGLIPSDRHEYVMFTGAIPEIDKANPRVEIEIMEYEVIKEALRIARIA